LIIPATLAEREMIAAEQPPFWEYLVFASTLVEGKAKLATKWDDHLLRLPRGAVREVDRDHATDFLSREIGRMSKRVAVLDRIFSPEIQEQAFGPRGRHGDRRRIEDLARRLIDIYEWMLDWAAQLRNSSVPTVFDELVETNACFIDQPAQSIYEFVDNAADQTSRLPELAAAGTDEHPVKIELDLKFAIDPAVKERHSRALEHLRRELT
jgi:hypothetical protein